MRSFVDRASKILFEMEHAPKVGLQIVVHAGPTYLVHRLHRFCTAISSEKASGGGTKFTVNFLHNGGRVRSTKGLDIFPTDGGASPGG